MCPRILPAVLLLALSGLPASGWAAEPRPLPEKPRAGGPLPGLSDAERTYFTEGLTRFVKVFSVAGTQPGASGTGLGPRFNLTSCGGCHAQPTVGGGSSQLNPQVVLAKQLGAANQLPDFIYRGGPTRVVRFVRNSDGSPDGSVHDLFVITGRPDAVGCTLAQPDFAAAQAQKNIVFRVPIQVFGAGLIESIPDSVILSNKAANAQRKAGLGISGHENRDPHDGTISRFGWKAQNRSLEIFASESYNVEQGVTSEIFPTERDETPGCTLNTTPEDFTDYTATVQLKSFENVTGFAAATVLLKGISNVTAAAAYMRFLAPPTPAPDNPSIIKGRETMASIGCTACHTEVLTTGNAGSPALRNQQARLYSDLLVHKMGKGLADGITQGNAQGDEFRTAPLWGLGQRYFFLHDGRTSDLTEAIAAHASEGSEANSVVGAFAALPSDSKQDLLNFLKAL
jgi:CxxC motif-containing protein (DUF1111 family)